MPLPEADVALIRDYCTAASDHEHASEARVECAVHGSAVDIVEASRMGAECDEDWLRVPSARLRYNATRGTWTLFCFNRDSAARRYDLWEPDYVQPGTVPEILAEVEADPTSIFWG